MANVNIGLQTDTLNPNLLRDTIHSLTDQFAALTTLNDIESSDDGDISVNFGRIEATVGELNNQLNTLSGVVKDVERLVGSSQEQDTDLITEHDRLVAVNRSLQNEVKKFKMKGNFESLGRRLSQNNVCMSMGDNENARRMRDTVRDELLTNLDHLQELRDQHANQRLEFNAEWEGLRADIHRYRGEERPHLELLDHTQDLIVARLQGIQNQQPTDGAQTDPIQDIASSTIQYIQAEREFRELKDILVDKQFQLRDINDEVDGLLAQKTVMWHQHARLEHDIVENTLVPDPDDGFILKHSVAHSNLPIRDESLELEMVTSRHNLNTAEVAPQAPKTLRAFKQMPAMGLLRKSSKQLSVCMMEPVSVDEPDNSRVSPLARQQAVRPELAADKNNGSTNESAVPEPEIAPDEPEQEPEPSTDQEEPTPEPENEPDEPSSNDPEESTAQPEVPRHRGDVQGMHDTGMLTKIRKRMGVSSSSNQQLHTKGIAAAGRTGSSAGFKAPSVFKRR
jgi:hypothetical protein